MKGSRQIARVLAVLVSASLTTLPAPLTTNGPSGVRTFAAPPAKAAVGRVVADAYGRLPVAFEANRGQADLQVKFLARGPGYTLFLTAQEMVFVLASPQSRGTGSIRDRSIPAPRRGDPPPLHATVLRERLVGGNPRVQVEGLEELPGRVNYFIGNDPTQWRTTIPIYARARYRAVYPGVDLVYYGGRRALEYDFVVAPGADPAAIRLGFEGMDRLEVDAEGDLVLHVAGGQIRQLKPRIYQEVAGGRHEIGGRYVLAGKNQVGVRMGAYDASRPLIIDPVLLAYSTYLGGSGDDVGWRIAVDAAHNAYVTGSTLSANFPTIPGAFQTAYGGGYDAFVTKLNATGQLVYSTYLGGSGDDYGWGIAVDVSGNTYVTGKTASTDFPTTAGSFQTLSHGPADAFVTKLNPTGSGIVYSTYLGGNGQDAGYGIALDAVGNAYVAGYTLSTDFPTTAGSFQTLSHGPAAGFVTKFNATGSGLVYSTYLGGSDDDEGLAIAVDAAGSAYVTGYTLSTDFPTTPGAFQTANGGGYDAFVSKLNATGSALVYSTYLGGNDDEDVWGIALDAAGNAYVAGYTVSTNFPTTQGAFQMAVGVGYQDAFVTKLNATGSSLVYSTYLGGNSVAAGQGIAVDAMGNAYVAGSTAATNFPTTPGAFQPASGGWFDAFVTKLNATGSGLVYSTYLGGSGGDFAVAIAVDAAGNAYVTGYTYSTNFPTRNPPQPNFAGGYDAFIARLSPAITIGLYDPTTGTFYLRNSNTSGVADLTFGYGPAGASPSWIPLVGQWTGPGVTTVGLYDSSTGTFYLHNSNDSGVADNTFAYGPVGWIPLAGDWTGQGKVTVGLYDPVTSTFDLRNSNSPGDADIAFSYGPAGTGWIPLVGDWTGQGKVTVGLYDPVTSTFYLRNSNSSGDADITFSYGSAGAGWIPVVGDWTAQGVTTVGLYDPATSTFYLRNSNTSGVADFTFSYGPAGASPPWRPLAGVWAGF